jgi:hypothetical protein
MTRQLRVFAWFVALSAIMLRAALPIGWMPVADASGGTSLVICTGHGPLATPIHSQKRTPVPGRGIDICPFAAVAHISPPTAFAFLAAPPLNSEEVRIVANHQTVVAALPFGNHKARAPPFLA